MPRPHKYGAVSTEYNGVTYASQVEATRAAELDLLVRGGVIDRWRRQVHFPLGEDFGTVVDFLVESNGKTWVEEVKGFETSDFHRVRRLWQKYGPVPMLILKRKGNGWLKETIERSET